jgi:hypothetical protein
MNPASLPRCKDLQGGRLAAKFKVVFMALLNMTTWFSIPLLNLRKRPPKIFLE